jgi:hypothetical protein
VIAVEGTLRMAGPAGSRAPSEVLQPADFLDALAPYGITWRIDSVERIVDTDPSVRPAHLLERGST